MRFPLLCLFVALLLGSARAAEPFFKKNDVIALVGGEDMVVASEYGYLELLLTRALPDYHLRFRNLAWEGDSVYEQRRDLNFPSWEEQLDKIGATVVICEFGQMESLDGKEKLSEFIATYQKLLERLSNGGKRRIVLITPHETEFSQMDEKPIIPNRTEPRVYSEAIAAFAKDSNTPCLRFSLHTKPETWKTREGLHLSSTGQFCVAVFLRGLFMLEYTPISFDYEMGRLRNPGEVELVALIVAKNKLWFNYWRPQNWAFLAGDRTNQPSSRDWRDPSKRWFPAEREEFLPLIEAKEKEIDALAAKLNQK